MSKKVTSDAAAYIRGKAERRGRNVEMAEKAVVESKSFTEKEALELKLIDLVAKDVDDLLAQLDGREVRRFDGTSVTLHLAGQRTVEVRMDWRQAILSAIARPEVLFLLLLGALAGLGAEISHPGLVFPGVLGTLCLILFLFASQIIPVNWAGVLLIVLAIGALRRRGQGRLVRAVDGGWAGGDDPGRDDARGLGRCRSCASTRGRSCR